MVKAVENIVENPALATRLSREGHQLALSCDWAPILDRWDSVLDSVVVKGQR
jgi:hypothetical protein